jgi:hypothetical protein
MFSQRPLQLYSWKFCSGANSKKVRKHAITCTCYPSRAWRVGVKISGVGEAAQNNAIGNKLRRNSLLYRSQRIDTYCPKYEVSGAERESRQPQDFGWTRCPLLVLAVQAATFHWIQKWM